MSWEDDDIYEEGGGEDSNPVDDSDLGVDDALDDGLLELDDEYDTRDDEIDHKRRIPKLRKPKWGWKEED